MSASLPRSGSPVGRWASLVLSVRSSRSVCLFVLVHLFGLFVCSFWYICLSVLYVHAVCLNYLSHSFECSIPLFILSVCLSHLFVCSLEGLLCTLLQVKLGDLREYLVSMRESGYAIVGMEQTLRSRCSSTYQFPHRTVLVLG